MRAEIGEEGVRHSLVQQHVDADHLALRESRLEGQDTGHEETSDQQYKDTIPTNALHVHLLLRKSW